MFTDVDERFMTRALELARRGLFTTDPNPRVGCVIVKNDVVIGEGWHEVAGQGHAEAKALESVEHGASGATVYVTLEPCSHQGRTGPCADALIRTGVGKVIVAMQDPNPKVSGAGLEKLRQAGIECVVGLMENEARELNPGFIHRMTQKRPWVRIKLAMSLDGRTAMANGESQWITGPDARLDVQRIRARSSAIITGVNTVIDDDAALTVRVEEWTQPYFSDDATLSMVRQPMRVVLDSSLKTPKHAAVLQQQGSALIVGNEQVVLSNESATKRKNILEGLDAEVLLLPGDTKRANDNDRIDLARLLKVLADKECNEVLVEAGATLAGEFFQQELWDELVVYVAPKLMGSLARPLLELPLDKMSQVDNFQWHDVTQVGSDIRLTLFRKG